MKVDLLTCAEDDAFHLEFLFQQQENALNEQIWITSILGGNFKRVMQVLVTALYP